MLVKQVMATTCVMFKCFLWADVVTITIVHFITIQCHEVTSPQLLPAHVTGRVFEKKDEQQKWFPIRKLTAWFLNNFGLVFTRES